MKGRVLIIAGSDSGGGAGIQADIKTVTALGGYAATAITALTAQDTSDVHAVMAVDPGFIRRQIEVVLADIGADCLKTGMLHSAEVVDAVCGAIESDAADVPLVADPVMVAKGGASLLDEDGVDAVRRRLLPAAAVITPNIPEAETLLGRRIGSLDDMKQAARELAGLGPGGVLVKGGHMTGPELVDVLYDGRTCHTFAAARIATVHTHGTGCTMASAIAAGLAAGLSLFAAVERAQAYVLEAIRLAPGLGRGHGPLNHGHTARPFAGA